MNRKKIVITFLIVTSVVTFTFGMFLMRHDSAAGHDNCIAGIIEGKKCDTQMNPLGSLQVHLGTIEQFITIPNAAKQAAALLSFFLLVLAATFVPTPPLTRHFLSRSADPDERQRAFGKFLSWFSILEKRDPSLQMVAG